MNPPLSISSQRPWQRNQNRVRHSFEGKSLGPVSNTVIIVLMLCILGLLYLTQINKTNAYTYPINNLQTKQSQLTGDQQDLQIQMARLQSLDRIQNSAVAKTYTAPTQVSYVNQ